MRTTKLALISVAAVAAALLVARSSPAFATEKPAEHGGAISLDDAFRTALARAETVNLQVENIKQAEEQLNAAKAAMQPGVNGLASYTVVQPTPGSDNSSSYNANRQPLAKVTATQPLFRGLRDFATLRQDTALINATKLDRDAAILQLYKDVAQAFFAVAAAERDLADLRTEIDFYEQRIKELKKFQRIGRSQLSDVLTAQSQQATLMGQEKQGKGVVRTNREILAVLTGLDPLIPLKVDESPPTEWGDLDAGMKRIDTRPEVAAADQQVRSADEAITVARNARLPSVDLNGDYYLVREGASKDVKWDIALALSVPIYDGGLITSQVETAVSKKRAGLDTMETARRAALQEIRTLYASLISDQEQIVDFAKATDLAQKTYKAESADYRLGLVTNLDVLSALTAFQEDQRALDKAKFQLLSDYEHFQAALGRRPAGFALSVPPETSTPPASR